VRHRWASFPPISPDLSLDRDEDFRRMTQYVMDCFDQAVREHPEDFFWFNGRWVLGEEKK
jgi:Kdo2-lipid IVA lauroyltransferase/acyltransferase